MTEPTRHRPVRSFVLRHGRMTDAQQRAMEELWPRWGLQSEAGPLNAREAFGREAPLVLEIGFGMGHSLLQMATARPELDYLGIEVHRPGVGRLLLSMEEAGIDNVRVYCDDAVAVVRDCLPDRSLDGVHA